MKVKIILMILVMLMAFTFMAGCSSSPGKLYLGLGQAATFRVGPGKDSADVQVYSFNYVTATAIFDNNGKIVNVTFDSLEVSTPNYPGASMPHFSGWPGTPGYNVTDHATGKVSGLSDNTKDIISVEVNGWKTKRERGDDYENKNWGKQISFYQNYFKGKTVDEIEIWFAKYFSDLDGRPLKADLTKEQDQQKYAKLSDAEKVSLTDVIAGATISLKDSHGDFIGALRKAFENRTEFDLSEK
jgi:hypothetical protein